MFENIDDKTKYDANTSVYQEDNRNAQSMSDGVMDPSSFSGGSLKITRTPVRVEASGKEANDLARKELKISSHNDKRAIINNEIANMKFYKNWRDRVSSEILSSPINEQKAVDRVYDENTKNMFTHKDDVETGNSSFDSIDREPGIEGNSLTNNNNVKPKPAKDYFDEHYKENTLEENSGQKEESLFDRLFRRTQEKFAHHSTAYQEPNNEEINDDNWDEFLLEDESEENLVQSDKQETNSVTLVPPTNNTIVVPKMQEKPTTRRKYNKKKKLDADIIGSAGFFTIG